MGLPALAPVCLSFLLGLLVAGANFDRWGLNSGLGLTLTWVTVTAIATLILPWFWRRAPRWWQWLIWGLIALAASHYALWRTPQPQAGDVSLLLEPPASSRQALVVLGTLEQGGRLNANGLQQFWLRVEQIQRPPDNNFQRRTGLLYLTVPPGVEPWQRCQRVRVSGTLYKPMAPTNPAAFNFPAYLAQQGIFAGLRGEEVALVNKQFCGLDPLRQRIVRAQGAWLPAEGDGRWPGLLISSIVLGQKAVNLPVPVRDLFRQVGLSHFLAASGYQVSLLMGTVLVLGQRLPKGRAIAMALAVLGLYLGLTGLEPSVVRASLMWGAVGLAMVSGRQVNSKGALLLIATVMLLVNPLWIRALGFQLSFLATLGILVTAPYLQQKLDFLPSRLAAIMAVPLAASLWTTPLLLAQFGYFIPAALPLNVIITPLLAVISLGGMVSAGLSLIFPPLGSALAWLVAFPTRWLMAIASGFAQLPTVAVGQMGWGQVALMYAVFVLVWVFPFWQRRWPWLALLLLGSIIAPLLLALQTRSEVTIFDSRRFPVLVSQSPGQVTVISPGDSQTEQQILQPFYAQRGLNQIQCPVVADRQGVGSPLPKDCQHLQWISQQPPVLQLGVGQQRWWLFLALPDDDQPPPRLPVDQRPQVIIWQGQFFPFPWLDDLRPPVAIAVAPYASRSLRERLERYGGQLWVTGDGGAVQWTPTQGFLFSNVGSEL